MTELERAQQQLSHAVGRMVEQRVKQLVNDLGQIELTIVSWDAKRRCDKAWRELFGVPHAPGPLAQMPVIPNW
jgi:RES domain-containing protein